MGLGDGDQLYRGAGCESCRMSGYQGRRGVFELMTLNEEVRRKILDSSSSGELRELARRQGMKTLREDGWRLVAEGATTADEVMRVTKDEELDSGLENTTA